LGVTENRVLKRLFLDLRKMKWREAGWSCLMRNLLWWWAILPPRSGWRWRQHGHSKRWYPTTALYGVTSSWKSQISKRTSSVSISPSFPGVYTVMPMERN